MAKVGDRLTAPEAGWKRINLTLDNVSYGGGTDLYNYGANTAYLGDTLRLNKLGAWVKFNFNGDRIRIIGTSSYDYETSIKINIDGEDFTFSECSAAFIWQALVFEKTGMSNSEHTVTITRISEYKGNLQVHIDAIDVAEGDIIPSPTNLTATAGDAKVTLNWNAVTGATGYNVKRSTTAGGPYTTITSNVQGTSYVDAAVTNGTTYYYVVTAITANGESGNSNEASATPQAAPVEVGNILLRITMNDSSEREYKVTKSIADDFANWCNRPLGTGNSCYVFNKDNQNSKEHLFYEKIISFEMIPVVK